jgi:FHA domain
VQTYGRKSDFDMCDYPIPSEDKKMSRLHFQIDCRTHNRRPSYILSDCGSVHGTRVTRQTEEQSYVLQLFASKQTKDLQDGVCLEPNDFIMAGVTILRFGIDQASDASVSDATGAQAGQYDPNKTTVFD